MGLVANRKSAITLHSGSLEPTSHRVRIVLAEKNISVKIVNIEPEESLSEFTGAQSVQLCSNAG